TQLEQWRTELNQQRRQCEVAKSFGGDASGRFVNGVLGAVFKEIPPKDIDKQPKGQPETAEAMPAE
ncbi:MAG TPA: hypothetical protein PLX67_01880, partial [bacterium]|nr:hypothetical protein [bacterium]